jgi:hypothetical protein
MASRRRRRQGKMPATSSSAFAPGMARRTIFMRLGNERQQAATGLALVGHVVALQPLSATIKPVPAASSRRRFFSDGHGWQDGS